ncbi:MAG TPA: metallophosphoesterase [Gemmatimonadaceae bacterium]|nr:metallophosphoesterase [Gemmatimonadaceae bacterium]
MRVYTVHALRILAPLALAAAAAACGDPVVGPAADSYDVGTTPAAARAGRQSVVLVGAGDIADCASSGDEATAAILDTIAGTVFTAGDNAYPNGSPLDFATCYEPSWGRHRARTRPAIGNHEYLTPGAAGYFAYFAERSAPPFGYYSYDAGAWHVVVLNSMLAYVNDPLQESWLRADLAAHRARCTLAYFHHPRFSSGNHGSQPMMRRLWRILYNAGADVVISGHDHDYERFAPQTPDGVADPRRGIREFVVGTGGASLYEFREPIPNSEVRYNASFGVLKLTLDRRGYSWRYIPTEGTFADAGSDRCH